MMKHFTEAAKYFDTALGLVALAMAGGIVFGLFIAWATTV